MHLARAGVIVVAVGLAGVAGGCGSGGGSSSTASTASTSSDASTTGTSTTGGTAAETKVSTCTLASTKVPASLPSTTKSAGFQIKRGTAAKGVRATVKVVLASTADTATLGGSKPKQAKLATGLRFVFVRYSVKNTGTKKIVARQAVGRFLVVRKQRGYAVQSGCEAAAIYAVGHKLGRASSPVAAGKTATVVVAYALPKKGTLKLLSRDARKTLTLGAID